MFGKKSTKIKKLKKERQGKAYRPIAKFFLFTGVILIFISSILYLLYSAQIIFVQPLYIAPIPLLKNKTINSLNNFDLTNEIKTDLAKEKIPYISVTAINGGYDIKLEGNQEVIFSSEKDIFLQTSSLQLVLNRLTIDGKRFSRLDFRYDK